jgi:hypothetical protein
MTARIRAAAVCLAAASRKVYWLVGVGELAEVRIDRFIRFPVGNLNCYVGERTSRA